MKKTYRSPRVKFVQLTTTPHLLVGTFTTETNRFGGENGSYQLSREISIFDSDNEEEEGKTISW